MSGTVGYNSKILVSNSRFSLGKNNIVNSLESENPPHAKETSYITHKDIGQSTMTHEEEKLP